MSGLCAISGLLIFAGLSTPLAHARPTYLGYSGAPGRGTCAASCHGQAGGNVTITGFPASYVPGRSYTLTIARASGNTINNFNASCRVGTGTQNAGTLTAGTGTETYNVYGETNGVHLTTANQASATFGWTAPAAGTGTVRLYCGAYQGTSYTSGLNTTLVLVSNEAAGPPGQASNPSPPHLAEGVVNPVILQWTAGARADTHLLFFGESPDPPLVAALLETQYALQPLGAGTTYFWRVDERNGAGTTTGPLWQFTTLAVPEPATNPDPPNLATDVPVDVVFRWTPGARADTHVVRLGLTNNPGEVGYVLTSEYRPAAPLLPDTVYYWQIREVNAMGSVESALWTFRTAPTSGVPHSGLEATGFALGPIAPNPFNSMLSVGFSLPRRERASLMLFDLTGRQVAVFADGIFSSGTHSIQWPAEQVATGVYFLRLQAGNQVRIAKVAALK